MDLQNYKKNMSFCVFLAIFGYFCMNISVKWFRALIKTINQA